MIQAILSYNVTYSQAAGPYPSKISYCWFIIIFMLDLFHHLADITQASSPFRIFQGALTIAELLFRLNSFHNRGTFIEQKVLPDIFGGIAETMADQCIARPMDYLQASLVQC